MQQSGFTIDALTYLLTPPAWTTSTQMTDSDIATALGAVRPAMLNPGGDVNGSVIAAIAANAHRPADAPIGQRRHRAHPAAAPGRREPARHCSLC